MSKFIRLLAPSYVGAALRLPTEGVIEAGDDEAARLIEDNLAEDVTADFIIEPTKPSRTGTASEEK